jgi:anti-sigma regulatory factor (Ser/Thr protein kinase)
MAGVRLIGTAFESATTVVADAITIATTGDTWLRSEGAKTVIALPLIVERERAGVIVLLARQFVEVEKDALRAISILAMQISFAMRQAPFFVISEFQRYEIELLTDILIESTSEGLRDDTAIYEVIANAARMLTGARTVGIGHENGAVVSLDCIELPRRLRFRMVEPHPDWSRLARGTVMRHVLPDLEVTLFLIWDVLFTPTEHQYRLLGSIANTLAALLSVRHRLVMADRERRAQYVAAVSKALSISLDSSIVLGHIQNLFVPAIADWTLVSLTGDQKSNNDTARKVDSPEFTRRASDAAPLPIATIGPDDPLRQANERSGQVTGELLVVPMVADGKEIGTIQFGRNSKRAPADGDDRELYIEMASLAGRAIANARSFRRERDTAEFLQDAFLATPLPKDSRILVDSVYIPAESRVGGDWFDMFRLDTDRLAVSCGDVAGHGMRAAVTMNVVRLALRSASLGKADPVAVLERGDRMLELEAESPMVTAVYGVLDLRRLVFSFASAGHFPALLAHQDGTIVDLAASGLPLGIGYSEGRAEAEVALQAGDVLVFYTDGLVEYARDLLSADVRLRELLGKLVAYEPRASLARALRNEMLCDATTQADDAAILTIALRPTSRTVEWNVPAVPASVPLLRGKLRDLWSETSCAGRDPFDFIIATGEALANAVEHAYESVGQGVRVRVSYDDDGVAVEIADFGHYKNGNSKADRGFGTAIMRAFADDFGIMGGVNGTVVKMGFSRLP